MALNFQEITLDTRTVSLIEVGDDQWIQESSLADIDKTFLEAALAEPTLADYTIPQLGITADVYFAPFIASAEELTERFALNRIRNNPSTSVRNLEKAGAEESGTEGGAEESGTEGGEE